MDKVELGRRVAEARERAGLRQESLAAAVGIDRSAVSRLEQGQRKIDALELAKIAEALGRPLAYFVSPVEAVVSRRRDMQEGVHDTSTELEAELGLLAQDLRRLNRWGFLSEVPRDPSAHTPRRHDAAEKFAKSLRARLRLDDGPVLDLGRACEAMGLVVAVVKLGEPAGDGGCVAVGDTSWGVALVNGDARPGRRRMTIAHELAHWVCGDAFDTAADLNSERMINSVAIHFLAPRSGVSRMWAEHQRRSPRDRALTVAAEYRLSWSAALSQLRNLDLVTLEEYEAMKRYEPTRGDYSRLQLDWDEDPVPYVSPAFAAACVNAYLGRRLTGHRAVEMLRGTLSLEDLPTLPGLEYSDLRGAFEGHGRGR